MIQALMRVIFFFSDFFEFVIKQKCLGSQCIFFLPPIRLCCTLERLLLLLLLLLLFGTTKKNDDVRKERVENHTHLEM